MKWFLKVIKDNYANFEGRARRKEYWMFALFHLIFVYGGLILLGLVAYAVDAPALIAIIYIYIFATLVPAIAVNTRRMHDVGKSGWYQLIPLYSFILAVTEGDRGPNQYGEDPKANENNNVGSKEM